MIDGTVSRGGEGAGVRMDDGARGLAVANRGFLYALLARAYAVEIDEVFADVFRSDHARAEVGLVEAGETDRMLALFDGLRASLDGPDAVAAVAREYVRLFVGPGTLRADPWETVQLHGGERLFCPEVLDVRAAYRAAGFVPARVRRVPDDFVGTELDFMAKLAEKARTAWQEGDEGALRERLEQSRTFLRDHLARWIGLFARAVEREYGPCFYAAFARFTELAVSRDEQVLACLLGEG